VASGAHIVPFIENTHLKVSRGMHGATGNIYCGLHEFEDMGFVLHFLRSEDLFVDVGANIGSYTILASGNCGAKTLAIEPVPETVEMLTGNVELNRLFERVKIESCALGEHEGVAHMRTDQDCTSHILPENSDQSGEAVPIKTLDLLLENDDPALIKIDVEGYEFPILKGASRTLAKPTLKAVIVESNESGQRYGIPDEKVSNELLKYDFEQFNYDPFKRQIARGRTQASLNSLFIRDVSFTKARVVDAPQFKILGHQI
jgi:FkbM family methyltransferase